jgi:lipopolysaccharide transport system ATP-binding protein
MSAIAVANLGKKYRIGERGPAYATLRDSLASVLQRGRKPPAQSEFWALKDVELEIQHGETVGIIGRNGAGKSTLLKILSRVTRPTRGTAELRGRVGSLLEVGTGFHPELTGKENIFLNGAILGMRRQEVLRKLDEIVAFAEVEQFLTTQVKFYSSGMYMRLAFAVAAHLEPEILIVDEVLAVGDVRFQRKCLGKMADVASHGRTVLFVSHNVPAVARLCTRGILLAGGQVIKDGPAAEVISAYMNEGAAQLCERAWGAGDEPGDDAVRLRRVRVINSQGKCVSVLERGQPIGIEIAYEITSTLSPINPSCRITNSDGVVLFQATRWQTRDPVSGAHTEVAWIPANLMAEGMFYASIGLATLSPVVKRVFEQDAVCFQVVEDPNLSESRKAWGGAIMGVIRPQVDWTGGTR